MALIYIVEDDKNILEIEEYALKSVDYDVVGFTAARPFYEAIREKKPDLVVLDVMLPDDDGLSIVENLRSNPAYKKLPIIMVTAKTTELDKVKGLDSGADDYLTKPFGVMELISRVKALLRRSVNTEEETYQVGGITMNTVKHRVYTGETPVELTYKEYELLKVLMANVGIAVSREILMEKVWGTNFEGESRTLDMHIKTLRQKLGEEGAHIRTVRNVGYRME